MATTDAQNVLVAVLFVLLNVADNNVQTLWNLNMFQPILTMTLLKYNVLTNFYNLPNFEHAQMILTQVESFLVERIMEDNALFTITFKFLATCSYFTSYELLQMCTDLTLKLNTSWGYIVSILSSPHLTNTDWSNRQYNHTISRMDNKFVLLQIRSQWQQFRNQFCILNHKDIYD